MRQALLEVTGVVNVNVSYSDKRANIQYEPRVVKPERLIAAIDGVGFTASLMENCGTDC